jgi:hypothetical protein
LKGLLDEYIDVLNLMGYGDISSLPFEQICEMCRKYSRGKAKAGKSQRDALSKVTKTATGSITKAEIGNLLENFKTELMGTLSSQFDAFNTKKRQEEENAALAIFCPDCRKRHPKNECPLKSIQICRICAEKHATKDCPSLPGLKAVYQEDNEASKTLYNIAPRRPLATTGQVCFKTLLNNFLPFLLKILHKQLGMLPCHGNHGLHNKISINLINKIGEPTIW